ncbi:hypothetical protein TRFO_42576 [Tritrichomonas foetus]|uniref:Uncharacterized protein n=1 Tax=Tritrichomonas foetus TaxID=1144522 RepID=A0A1J4KVT3_9EUKA|nr:hypothetical protein TRFO_42576 [Tritrichomonas foetus]|eukprot:OHT15339.1 hypothetical protein TRFO_42576 [Tritrichomonas foetus]
MLKGLIDLNSIQTPTRLLQQPPPQQDSEMSQQKSPEGASFFDNLPPIGGSAAPEVRNDTQPRRILLGKSPMNDNNENSMNFDLKPNNVTTPRRLINLGGSANLNSTPNNNLFGNSNNLSTPSNNNNSSDTTQNSMTISGIVFPPLPGDTPPNSPPKNTLSPIRQLNQSPTLSSNNEMPKPIFAQFQPNTNDENSQYENTTQIRQQPIVAQQPILAQQNGFQNNTSFQPQNQNQYQQPLSPRPQNYQERLNQSLPPNNFNQEPIIQQRQENYTEIMPRRTPAEYFESSINGVLDRSLSTFKRSVSREISSAFRPNNNNFDVSMFDSFLTGLLNDVNDLFEIPQSNANSNESSLTRKLSQTFDENAKPIRKLFADAEVRNAQTRDKRVDELKSLSSALSELRSAVKGIADATMQELERERYDAAARRDEEQARARAIERRARSLKLKRSELDSKLSHQKIEKESLERLMKQMEDAKREWEEQPVDSGNTITQKLQKEIDNLRNELSGDATDKVEILMQECASMMSSVRDGLRDEVCEMDVAEKWAVSRLRSPMRRGPVARFDQTSQQMPMNMTMPINMNMNMSMPINGMPAQQPSRQPVVQYAQERILEKRKERESNMREVNQYRGYTSFGPGEQ